jgi:hypothetical protein
MKPLMRLTLAFFGVASAHSAISQGGSLGFPKTVEAGASFTVQLPGSGEGTLYIVGPGGAIKRDVRFGEELSFPAGSLSNAGHYVAFATGGPSDETSEFDVVPANKPADISFLAKPSRLPVGLRNGITGAMYVFDDYHNLITVPLPIQFELSNPSGSTQTRSTITRYGAAWTEFDSTPQQGADKFLARAGDISSLRVIRQVPGDPCELKMSVAQSGERLQLVTQPVRDCSGNAVPDGTIVTFTQTYHGAQSVVDVPLKRGIAQVEVPSHVGATISVASGVVLGNQVQWEK